MKKKKTIHIAIAFDSNYIKPFYVLLTSVFLNNQTIRITIHAIGSGITEEEKKTMIHYAAANEAEIFFYMIGSRLVENLPVPKDTYVSLAGYYRLFFPLLVPSHIKTIIYLDTDILVIGNLEALYDISSSYPVSAIVDAEMPLRSDLGLEAKESYFNSGVLVIDLDRWNSQKISEKTITLISECPYKLTFMDQDALNCVLMNNWNRIDSRFNFIPVNMQKLSGDELEAFLQTKVIIHYAGLYKPWAVGKAELVDLYVKYQNYFFKTEIGKAFAPDELETAIIRILERCDQDFVFLALHLHLLWINEVKKVLSTDLALAFISGYYKRQEQDNESSRLAGHQATFDAHKELILEIFNDAVHDKPSGLLASQGHRLAWRNLCKKELAALPKGSATVCVHQLNRIPNLINEKLLVNGDVRSILFFAVTKSWNDFQHTSPVSQDMTRIFRPEEC